MTDLSLALDVAGAALFALVGVGILLVSGGARRGLLVGAVATTFGTTWVAQNLVATDSGTPLGAGDGRIAQVAFLLFAGLAAVACVALAHHLAWGLPRARRRLVGVAVALSGGWVAIQVLILPGAWGHLGATTRIVYSAFLLALIHLVAAIAAAFRESGAAPRALACLGLAFAPFVSFLFAALAASAGFAASNFGTGRDLVWLALGCVAAVAIVPFARGPDTTDRLSRAVFPALVVSGLAGVLIARAGAPTYDEGYGSFGIVRTIGAFFLALAVLRYDLLQVPLPRFATRGGSLATGALAVLFIVAQVAQEFFAAEYGLLMGGVVAGALLFAANPLQRTMERFVEGRAVPVGGPAAPSAPAPAADAARREAVFRDALRVALRDRRLTRAEEVRLHRLAEELGIGAGRAHEILAEVEAEAEDTP